MVSSLVYFVGGCKIYTLSCPLAGVGFAILSLTSGVSEAFKWLESEHFGESTAGEQKRKGYCFYFSQNFSS